MFSSLRTFGGIPASFCTIHIKSSTASRFAVLSFLYTSNPTLKLSEQKKKIFADWQNN
jgi:hypothetical protein